MEETSNVLQKNTNSFNSIEQDVVNIRNSLHQHTMKLDQSRVDRKQLESKQNGSFFRKFLSSLQMKMSNIKNQQSNNLEIQQQLDAKMVQFINNMVQLENSMISGFNNNTLRQNDMARSVAETEIKLMSQLRGLNISMYTTVYTILKSQINNIISVQTALKQNRQYQNALNTSFAMLNTTVQNQKVEDSEFEAASNETIQSILQKLHEQKENGSDLIEHINEQIKNLYDDMANVKLSGDSVERHNLTNNVFILENKLDGLKKGK